MSIAAQLADVVRAEVARRLDGVAATVVSDTMNAAPKDTGELGRSVRADTWQDRGNGQFSTTIRAEADHARYVEEGTGIYGPRGTRIFPRSGGVLVFFWNNGPNGPGTYAFRSVAGQRAQPFFYAAMPDRFQQALNEVFG